MPKKVLYAAAHAGFDLNRVPLGGAATIASLLMAEWSRTHPFELELLTPALLGRDAPRDKDLVRFSELRYARFCFQFEAATTAAIERHDPAHVRILCNDVSEGPAFRALAEKGYSLFTIYHVNVADYFAQMYLRGVFPTARVTAWHARLERSPLRRLLPRVLDLVFKKQHDSLVFSRGVIVPSEGMKQVLRESYPAVDAGKIHVLPWGVPEPPAEDAGLEDSVQALRERYQITPETRVLMTLSRISPEKGQDRLLRALYEWENRPDFPADPVVVILCGEPAYMQGVRFEKKLRRLAARLRKVRVFLPGHVSGITKQAYLRLADLYVFPSRHESYGLTLLEALQAGVPALACEHYGADEVLDPELGVLLPAAPESQLPTRMADALAQLLNNREALKQRGDKAKAYAARHRFEDSAARLAEIIQA
jgi:glycosyltransferase involved in cell wall biosynthesis